MLASRMHIVCVNVAYLKIASRLLLGLLPQPTKSVLSLTTACVAVDTGVVLQQQYGQNTEHLGS